MRSSGLGSLKSPLEVVWQTVSTLSPAEDGATYFMFMDTWYREALPPSDAEEQPGGPGGPGLLRAGPVAVS